MLSKIERGERRAKREHIPILASLLKSNEKELFTIWLADQVYELLKKEENATEILKTVGENFNTQKKKQYSSRTNKHSSGYNIAISPEGW